MRQLLFAVLFICMCGNVSAQKDTIHYGDNAAAGHYAKVNGINLYYETYGNGEPLVLLHGNGGSIASATMKIQYLQKFFKVIAVDTRSNGKSIDTITKVFKYEQFASDLNQLLDQLHIDSAYIFGQSDGGIIGLLMAINYPPRVKRLATFGANLNPGFAAIDSGVQKLIMKVYDTTKNSWQKNQYEMMLKEPHITLRQLHQIQSPVLIMSGDRDAINLEHTILIFKNIKRSNLFIMPGATHFGSYQKPNLFNEIILDFFKEPFMDMKTADFMKMMM